MHLQRTMFASKTAFLNFRTLSTVAFMFAIVNFFSTHFFIRFQSNFSSIWHLQHYDNITVRPTTSSAIMQHIS